MTIQLDTLTITATTSEHNGSTHYEITSVRDQAGDELHNITPQLLDRIEEAIEDEMMVEYYEAMMQDNEIGHVAHLYL